jgi:hypothetical protein
MADAAEPVAAADALTLLPSAVQALIFAQLPVDLRARCACVCRGWRDALAVRSLWTRLDVSRTSGVTARVTDAFLRGAAARAGGELESLDASGSRANSRAALLEVTTANAAALRLLRVCNGVCNGNLGEPTPDPNLLSLDAAKALLRAAPALRVLDADLNCISVVEARTALRAVKRLLTPLRVHGLRVYAAGVSEAEGLALEADVAAHAWLQELYVTHVRTLPAVVAVVDALVDAALARRLTAVQFVHCSLCAAAAPALARLLGSSALTELLVWGAGRADDPLVDAHAAAALANALRANATLTSLQLGAADMWRDAAAANTLLGALTAHPSLRTLSLRDNSTVHLDEADHAAVSTSLASLLAANSPALTALDLNRCNLGDAGMAPLLDALRVNTHLRSLTCNDSRITAEFAADVLLPAVRANVSLRVLDVSNRMGTHASERQAEVLVSRRV